MKTPTLSLALIVFSFFSFVIFSSAQTMVKVVRGNLDALKGEKNINIEFSYDNVMVGAELTEDNYVTRKKREYNEKEARLGDRWERIWYGNRKKLFEPEFLASFELNSLITTGYILSKYTLILNTNYIESGWNYGLPGGKRLRSRISGDAIVIETANPDNVIALITLVNVKGNSAMFYEFDAGFKIQEAYDNAGKAVGKLFR